jgi:CheY-like chemotaxis protein
MENTELPNSGYVDSLRLSARQHADILHELDAKSRPSDQNRRTDERLRFTEQALLFVHIRHPGGTDGNYLVRTRNLSRTGIGFFHGSFVYSGTPCTIALRSVDKVIVAIEGKVVRCNHVRGHIHEIGVHFEKPIRLRQFLGQSAPADAADPHSTELPQLAGRVLYVDDSAADQDLFNFHLHNLGLQCNIVTNALDALDLAESAKFDLVLTSTSLTGGFSANQLVTALRESGYKGPIIGVTADERDAARAESVQRGFSAQLVKPYRFEDLLQLLLKYFTPRSGGSQEVLASELWPDHAMRPLIKRFLERLGPQVTDIRRLAKSPTDPVFRKYCTDLKGSAGGYGYPTISQAATALLDHASPHDFAGRLATLERLCLAATRFPDADASGNHSGNSNVSDAA